jgi:hypothetical protein
MADASLYVKRYVILCALPPSQIDVVDSRPIRPQDDAPIFFQIARSHICEVVGLAPRGLPPSGSCSRVARA